MAVKGVIFDLDGTILDTESLVLDVSRQVLAKHGKQLTPEAIAAGTGRRPLEAWQAVLDALEMQDCTAQQLFDESEPILQARWHEARLLPGAARLLQHLQRHAVPVALATSTSRAGLDRKLSGQHATLRQLFVVANCGDEVANGKPAPDCFRAAAERLGLPPAACLAIEDAPSGVQSATAAGMRVVVVPSLTHSGKPSPHYPTADPDAATGCCSVLPSLLEFRPERFGLPAFDDLVAGEVVPIEPPWRMAGLVVKGFGRGSRELGIPTANLDAAALQSALAEAVTGIYSGWASVGDSNTVYKMVMSIGWNPFYKNETKTAEPWLLHDFESDFYGQELRLVVCGYIRPEQNFTSLDALVARIHEDAAVTHKALQAPVLAAWQSDSYLHPQRT